MAGGSWSTKSIGTFACLSTHSSNSRHAAFAVGATEYILALKITLLILQLDPGLADGRAPTGIFVLEPQSELFRGAADRVCP